MFANRYNQTYPPMLVHAGLYFVTGYSVSCVIFLFIEWVKSKMERNQ